MLSKGEQFGPLGGNFGYYLKRKEDCWDFVEILVRYIKDGVEEFSISEGERREDGKIKRSMRD